MKGTRSKAFLSGLLTAFALTSASMAVLAANPELLTIPEPAAGKSVEQPDANAGQAIELVVVVVVDQLRPDRLSPSMPGGLGTLQRMGRVFTDAELQHAVTTTCPGHAVVLSGVQPGRAGVPDNSYFDREAWETVYCVQDKDAVILDQAAAASAQSLVHSEPEEGEAVAGRSPARLRVSTLGAWLKAAHPTAQVLSIGSKDRASIMLAGHKADLAIWFDRQRGYFTSSDYYADVIPPWVQAFNGPLDGSGVVQRLQELPAQWTHDSGMLRADDYVGEDDEFGRTSGHPLGQGDLEARAQALYHSPYLDEMVLQLAAIAVEKEQLLSNGTPDLLAISLAATDTVGHRYGPFSAESADTLARVDKALGDFLDGLDAKGDLRQTLVVLTADHGVAPLPEWAEDPARSPSELAAQSICPEPGGRVSPMSLFGGLYWSVYWNFTAPFGKPWDLLALGGTSFYINRDPEVLGDHSIDEVAAHVAEYLEEEAFVRRVWKLGELADPSAEDLPSELTARYLNSFDAERSGDLLVQVEPGCIVGLEAGTTHGSPYGYDAQVPLIFFGNGVSPGVSTETAASVDIAPTLAELLGIEVPENLDGRVLPLR